jgi:hypothetical protein
MRSGLMLCTAARAERRVLFGILMITPAEPVNARNVSAATCT